MLKRPARRLPSRFNRPVTDRTRSFVERRHRRVRERIHERWKRQARRWKSGFLERVSAARRWLKLVVAGFAIFGVCLLVFSPILQVREIRVVRSEGRIDLRAVLTSLAPLYGRHLLFVSAYDIGARVRQAVPDASDVTVSKRYPSELFVRISVAPLVARVLIEPVSGGTAPVDGVAGTGTGSRPAANEFLTANGILVVGTAPAQPLPTIRIVDWGVRPTTGARVLTPELLERMKRAEETLALEFGQKIVLRTVYMRAREFHLETPTISYWFDMRAPLQNQLQRLRTFLMNAKLQDVKSYVDLRLIGRVVYK